MEDIRDLKGFVPVPHNWWWLVLAVAVVVLAGWLSWWWVKRLRRHGPTATAAPPPSPLEVALAALQRLREVNLPVAEFYTRLADIVRQFIEGRYDLHAPDRTTEEFLAEASLPEQQMALLRVFLHEADLVKFARHRPGKDEMDCAFVAAEKFV
ncbi:MAG: hypothetical protein WCH84_08240, partial [Verrucomicrobiota bacterium]